MLSSPMPRLPAAFACCSFSGCGSRSARRSAEGRDPLLTWRARSARSCFLALGATSPRCRPWTIAARRAGGAIWSTWFRRRPGNTGLTRHATSICSSLTPAERAALFNAAYEGYLGPFHLDDSNSRSWTTRSISTSTRHGRISRRRAGRPRESRPARRGGLGRRRGRRLERAPLGCRRSLMEALREKARERGVKRVWLEVIVENSGAVTLYEKLGYRSAGPRGLDAARDRGRAARPRSSGRRGDGALPGKHEPWQRADGTLDHYSDVRGLVTGSGAMLFCVRSGGAAAAVRRRSRAVAPGTSHLQRRLHPQPPGRRSRGAGAPRARRHRGRPSARDGPRVLEARGIPLSKPSPPPRPPLSSLLLDSSECGSRRHAVRLVAATRRERARGGVARRAASPRSCGHCPRPSNPRPRSGGRATRPTQRLGRPGAGGVGPAVRSRVGAGWACRSASARTSRSPSRGAASTSSTARAGAAEALVSRAARLWRPHGSDVLLAPATRVPAANAQREPSSRGSTRCSRQRGDRAAAAARFPGRYELVPHGVDPSFRAEEEAHVVVVEWREGERPLLRSLMLSSRAQPDWELVLLRTRMPASRPAASRRLRGGCACAPRPPLPARNPSCRIDLRPRADGPSRVVAEAQTAGVAIVAPAGRAAQPELAAAETARMIEDEAFRSERRGESAAAATQTATALADRSRRSTGGSRGAGLCAGQRGLRSRSAAGSSPTSTCTRTGHTTARWTSTNSSTMPKPKDSARSRSPTTTSRRGARSGRESAQPQLIVIPGR